MLGDYIKVKIHGFVSALDDKRLVLMVLGHGSHSLTCKQHHACLHLVSIHLMAPPQTPVVDT